MQEPILRITGQRDMQKIDPTTRREDDGVASALLQGRATKLLVNFLISRRVAPETVHRSVAPRRGSAATTTSSSRLALHSFAQQRVAGNS